MTRKRVLIEQTESRTSQYKTRASDTDTLTELHLTDDLKAMRDDYIDDTVKQVVGGKVEKRN